MNVLKQKLFKTTEGFFLVFYVVLLLVFGCYLIRGLINYSSVLEIFSSLIWIMLCIAQIFIQWRTLTTIKSEEEPDREEINIVVAQGWSANELWGIITISVLFAAFMAIVAILLINHELTNIQLSRVSQHKPLSIYSNILIGLALSSQALEQLLNLKKDLFKRILILFNLLAISFAVLISLK